LIKHTFFLNKNSVVDLDPEFLFGSGTRENPSGYTTHEITIFKYKMGDFCFWPKETMYQQLRFYFDIFRFYQDFTFLIIAGRFFIMGAAFQWFGRSLGHSSTLLLSDGTASFLSRFGLSGSLPLQTFFANCHGPFS